MIERTSRNLYSFSKTIWSFLQDKRINFGKYAVVMPGKLSPQKTVPDYIEKPSYHLSGIPTKAPGRPEIKSKEQISKMRDSCRLAANILKYVGRTIHVGQTTEEIANIVHNLAVINGSYPSPLNYKKFPKSVCTSVNNVACHGIPDDRPLEDGDIINVDITVYYKGYHGDCSATFKVGNVDEKGRKLIEATETCLHSAISICEPGLEFSAIGECIESLAENLGFSVIPVFAGHGIGQYFHGPPDIYHVQNDYSYKMEAGMTFTIEPILSQGSSEVYILDDNWTAITEDNSRTAQFEHTILITQSRSEILTMHSDDDITKGFKYEDLKMDLTSLQK